MPKSLINGLTPEPLFYADVFSLVTQGRFAFDDQDWADALPSGNRASSITISTEYTYQIHNQPDFAMEAGLTFYGKFRKVDGDWTGKITQVEFERDGMVVGDIQIRSGVDFSRVQDVKPVGLIWNELTVTGLKGSLTSAQDYINGSLGDDIIFAGGGRHPRPLPLELLKERLLVLHEPRAEVIRRNYAITWPVWITRWRETASW